MGSFCRGQHCDNVSPVNGKIFCKSATTEENELDLNVAHAAKDKFDATTFENRKQKKYDCLSCCGSHHSLEFSHINGYLKLSPALAGANCIIIKPTEQTPASIIVLMEVWVNIVAQGVINAVTGYGPETGKL
ncbi:Acetaldehyde dehydrogenase 2 [Galdieria sulphuraria]|uniref:Aldehyde dehydrogenase (NAD) family protein n=1 Tax=Galdieria sulphuraria TaxID=130081 RepID=M2XAJ7_GALSU|nr:aldehyde dehydrogenase (NAD) family protein [Galdieria sulphuraria]EME26892.1 aldehyde dehydrogenase (NAD) family protein [Galdieria sulphuraria]GJD10640.1 Acetaldehyde dehydrogenase 2 [Galdieria sulphuraria]|eukprot:XP_005703412.1 aldehyde dehydrogenase (NAD) family protein [Galdieria sulphuraria]